jgi:hypothetical protein
MRFALGAVALCIGLLASVSGYPASAEGLAKSGTAIAAAAQPLQAPIPETAVAPWTGVYLGGGYGYGIGDTAASLDCVHCGKPFNALSLDGLSSDGWQGDGRVGKGPQRFYRWVTTSVWVADTAPYTIDAHADDFMSADRVPLDFDLSVTARCADWRNIPEMIDRFGTADCFQVLRRLVLQLAPEGSRGSPRGEFMSYLRDQVRHHNSSVFIAAQDADGKPSDAASEVERQTREHINRFLEANGAAMIKVDNIALGRANPPPGVRASIEATAQQAQDIKTQVERERAQKARLNAEVAAAAAERAFMDSVKLNSAEFIELQRIRAWEKVCVNNNICVFTQGAAPPLALPMPRPVVLTQQAEKKQ